MNAIRRKIIPLYFSYTRCDDFAAYLSQMAAKGWQLKKLGAFMEFEESEPAYETYDVQVFLSNGDLDYIPNPYTDEFSDYCKNAGWELVAYYKYYIVLKRLETDAIPIFTPAERIANAYQGDLKNPIARISISIALAAVCLFRFQNYGLTSPVGLYILYCVFHIILHAGTLIYLSSWKSRKFRELSETGKVYCGNGSVKPFSFIVYNIFLGVLIAFAVFVFVQNSYAGYREEKKRQAEEAEAIAGIELDEINIQTEIEPKGERIDNTYFEVIIPEGWTYQDWRRGLEKGYGLSFQWANATRNEVYGSGRNDTLPPEVHFNYRDIAIPMAESLRMNVNPIAEVSITVNGRCWTGFHGYYSDGGGYTCTLETPDGSHMLEIWLTGSDSLILEDEEFLTILAGMHYTGE